jgi:hypothetical protein
VDSGHPQLWPTCPLANCPNPTSEAGQPCDECIALFGDHLRPTGQPVPVSFEERMRQGDLEVRRILTQRREMEPLPQTPPPPAAEEWKMNQLCWVCEQRRKCRRDTISDYPGREPQWICGICEKVT